MTDDEQFPLSPLSKSRSVLGSPPVPRRVRDWAQEAHTAGPVVRLLGSLLALRGDIEQFGRLASMAVLAAEGATASRWSTGEMDVHRATAEKLKEAWTNFVKAPRELTNEMMGYAALHLAYQEIVGAIRGRALIPSNEELLVRVAVSLLGSSFRSLEDVEAAHLSLVARCGGTAESPLIYL